MLETGVLCAGIDHRRKPQLLDAREALQQRMPHHIVQQSLGYVDKPENRVVDYFTFVGHDLNFARKGRRF